MSTIKNKIRLGKGINIPARAILHEQKKGCIVEYYVDSVMIIVGIGKNHSGELIMSRDAWIELNKKKNIKIRIKK